MKRFFAFCATLGFLLGASTAHAQTKTKIGFRYWHGDFGFGVRGGGGTVISDGQLYAGAFFARTIEIPGWSPFVGTGLHLSGGNVRVDDPQAIEGVVENIGRFAIGPEIRFGMARGKKVDAFDRAWPDVQFYFSSALTSVHAGTLSTRLPEAGQGWNGKFGLGMSFPALYSLLSADDKATVFVIFLPNTFAFDMEVPFAEPTRMRFGARIGYGF